MANTDKDVKQGDMANKDMKHATVQSHEEEANVTRRRSSFSKPMVCSIVEVDLSPDSVVARGGLEPPPFTLPPAHKIHRERIVWLTLKGRNTRLFFCCASLCLTLCWVDTIQQGLAFIDVQADVATLTGVLFAGFVAQLVDGALGMGYGITSSTVLVAAGLSPVLASQCVHLAQLGTTLLSGLSHHSCGTVDWPTTKRIAVPGVCGALLGARLLSVLPIATAKTLSSALLLTVGAYLAVRFYRCPGCSKQASTMPKRRLLLIPIGALGGFVDVAGGGGWGPVATSGLLAEGCLSPHRCIGTVSMSEFFVTVAAVGGFALSSGHGLDLTGLRVDLMVALLLGGLLAAPVAPLVVTRMPSNLLGVVVGGFICLSNARVLLRAASVTTQLYTATLLAMVLAWVGASARVAFTSPDEQSE